VDITPDVEINPFNIDTTYYYRLTNTYTGPNLALDIINDGSNYGLTMSQVSDNTGQYWRFIDLGNNVYRLQTRFLKNKYSLDIVNDENKTPHMAITGDFTGQYWHLTRFDDGTFKLNNDFTGKNMVLDVRGGTYIGYMSNINADYTGQHWMFKKIGKIANY